MNIITLLIVSIVETAIKVIVASLLVIYGNATWFAVGITMMVYEAINVYVIYMKLQEPLIKYPMSIWRFVMWNRICSFFQRSPSVKEETYIDLTEDNENYH